MKSFFKDLAKETKELNFERDFTREIILVAREMSWTIDYIMDLSPIQLYAVKDTISYLYKEQNKQYRDSGSQGNSSIGTFG